MPSDLLAKSLLSEQPILINIPIYYTYIQNKYGAIKIRILEDDEAKEMLEDVNKKDTVEIINTKWKQNSWDDQNSISEECNKFNKDTGKVEPNFFSYRKLRVLRFLVDWDLQLNGQKVPVSEEFIGKLPPEIVVTMFERYEKGTIYDPDEQSK